MFWSHRHLFHAVKYIAAVGLILGLSRLLHLWADRTLSAPLTLADAAVILGAMILGALAYQGRFVPQLAFIALAAFGFAWAGYLTTLAALLAPWHLAFLLLGGGALGAWRMMNAWDAW